MLVTHSQESCTRNLHSFLVQKNLHKKARHTVKFFVRRLGQVYCTRFLTVCHRHWGQVRRVSRVRVRFSVRVSNSCRSATLAAKTGKKTDSTLILLFSNNEKRQTNIRS